MNIGEKIKTARLHNRLTLEQLSKKTGISVGQLSQIERGLSSPTFSKIQLITEALGVNLGDLVNENDPPRPPSSTSNENRSNRIAVVRGKRRKKVLLPSGVSLELLAPVHDKKIEFIYLRYPVGEKIPETYTHGGEECGIVLQGRFRGIIGDEKVILEAGDSIYFDSTIPHKWENVGDVEVIAIWAVTPPSL